MCTWPLQRRATVRSWVKFTLCGYAWGCSAKGSLRKCSVSEFKSRMHWVMQHSQCKPSLPNLMKTYIMNIQSWHHLTGKLVQQGWIISTAIHFLAMTKTLKLNNLIPMPCPKYRYPSISNWGPAYEDLELCCGCQDLPGKLSLPDYRRDLSLRSCQMHINPGPEENAATIKQFSRR